MSQQRPLKILVISEHLSHLITKLSDQGHTLTIVASNEHDLILGERCCRVTEELVPYIDTTIKEVQRGKYAKRPKKVPGGTRVQGAG
jgi:hypothetical protein